MLQLETIWLVPGCPRTDDLALGHIGLPPAGVRVTQANVAPFMGIVEEVLNG